MEPSGEREIIAPRRSSSAHLHRPWRANSAQKHQSAYSGRLECALPTTTIVDIGPYRLTGNPIYLRMAPGSSAIILDSF
jgi:hypothetical protein